MRHHTRSGGFTLIEVSLAMVIGIIVLGGAITLYNQVKVSAANGEAKSRALALAALVEEHASRSTNYPKLDELNKLWEARRPDDAKKNPWGGELSGDPIDGHENVQSLVSAPVVLGSGERHIGVTAPTTLADRGRLYYFRHANNEAFWIDDFSLAGADEASGTVRVQGYGIAYVGPNGENWYNVTGKANALDPDAQYPGGPIRGKITN
ncbi:type II secretion system protein [bacterium]|nr:type II secretion system protein [bacterium]